MCVWVWPSASAQRSYHMQHVERAEGEESSEDNGHAAREVVPQRSNGRGSPLVILRDEVQGTELGWL